MILLNPTTKQAVSVSPSQYKEWRNLLAAEIKRRNLLEAKHRAESTPDILAGLNCVQKADLIKRQTAEILQFRKTNQEKRLKLSLKHEKNLFD